MITKHKPNNKSNISTTHIFIGTQKVNLLNKHYLMPNYRYLCVPFAGSGDAYYRIWTKSGKYIGEYHAEYFKEYNEDKEGKESTFKDTLVVH